MYDLIHAKKTGGALAPEQIQAWVRGVVDGSVPPEQSAALLMAICWRGMDTEETLALTLAMRDSGDRMDLSAIPGTKVDKHSTGGVGDKTTLIIGPVVAACGVPCAMFSGRGLGHTGGTVDKYSAIPGLRVELEPEAFRESLRATGFANSAQTGDICPADRRLYALRDITATVESIPLITASIMSKKLAGGADALVLDVKCGGGAFMRTLEEAQALARSMVDVGRAHGMRIKALLTRMEEPLGWAIGNALEVMESVEILKGWHGECPLAQMSFRLAGEMLVLGGVADGIESAMEEVKRVVHSGEAMERFRAWTRHNGGDVRCLDDFSRLPQAGQRVEIRSGRSAWIEALDSRSLGILAMELGAGRRNQGDVLDLGVGLKVHGTVGGRVEAGDVLFTIYAKAGVPIDPDRFLAAVCWSETPLAASPWLLGVVE
ncbi:thymidine phosphorylase [Holophaga foetida]|uniref:thymidine phosphorylase n=1 Tax=Holophaga foetida TaxID=35839 RepID=UPI0002472EC8|nr:thymidine phosphorylase [Holophaga foetida]